MPDKAEIVHEYWRVRDFFIAACEDESVIITPQLGLSKQIDISESIYFEIYNGRIFDIKIRYDTHNFPDDLRYDHYFSEFPAHPGGDMIPYLAIDLIGPISDLRTLWKLRNIWLNDRVDEDDMSIILEENSQKH